LNKLGFRGLGVLVVLTVMASGATAAKRPQPPRVLNHGDWVTSADLPASGAEISEPVSVDFRLAIDEDGRAKACTIMRGSGSKILDEWTCALVMKRARFKPAKDAEGKATQGSYFETVRWLPRK
jgi:hypothetical protein